MATTGPMPGPLVIKYGGAALPPAGSPDFDAALVHLADDLSTLARMGKKAVVVHGGGREVSETMRALGKEPVFVSGRRVTDPDSMDIVQMVLVGRVNRAIVRYLSSAGVPAVGICGQDAGLALAVKRVERDADGKLIDLGQVGDVAHVNPGLLAVLLDNGYVPVVAPVAADSDGLAYNINADTMAGALAAALRAECFVLLSDVPGLLADPGDPRSLVSRASRAEITALMASGRLVGGMIPKVEACLLALEGGAATARIASGSGRVVAEDGATDGAGGTTITL